MSNIETIEKNHQELISKKAKLEAQLDLHKEQLEAVNEKLKGYNVETLEDLERLIEQKTEEYEEMKTEVLENQTNLIKEIDDVISAVKV